jgi:hypothetical protein
MLIHVLRIRGRLYRFWLLCLVEGLKRLLMVGEKRGQSQLLLRLRIR